MSIILDLDEGRYLELGCLTCREDVRTHYTTAHPFRMYIAALECGECGEQLITFDAFSMEAA